MTKDADDARALQQAYLTEKALADRDALIRELVAALTEFLEFGEYAYSHGREALAKAKAQGYEP